ncbi:MAG: hypothetical protein U0807_18770 [Candidatus Binatia bacterium]
MRRTLSGIAVAACAVVLATVPALAAVDLTGSWALIRESIAGPVRIAANFVQSGTVLSFTYTVEGGSPQGAFTGTIDPDTGTFSVPLPPSPGPFPGSSFCTGNNIISGTATPDGMTMQGIWPRRFFRLTPPPGCYYDGDLFTGTRLVRCQPSCGPCEMCMPTGCTVPIAHGCQPASSGKSSITVRGDTTNPAKDTITWTWKGSATVLLAAFGHPLQASSYTLCLIDREGGVATLRMSRTAPAGGLCPSASCWTATASSFEYRDEDADPEGLTSMVLHAGTRPGRGKIAVKGKGSLLGVPVLGLMPPVIVRLVRDDAPLCWEATYSSARVNDAGKLKAKSD